MDKVHIVTISAQGLIFKYAFYQRPSETKIKSLFFRDHKDYKRKEWGITILFEREEIVLF